MKKFQDSQGGAWEVDLTIGNIFRVKDATNGRFDLFEPKKEVDGVPLGQLLDESDGVFWELLCQLIEPQILERKMTIPDFGKVMAADCWPVARRIFFEAWVDFFQSLQRPDKALPLEKLAKYQVKALELVKAKLEDPRLKELDPKVYSKMQSALNTSFSQSLDLLESTLAPSPGDDSTK